VTIVAKHDNLSQQVKKTLPDGKVRVTHERTTCGLRLNRFMEKNETLNESGSWMKKR
jgi:hypothetical protein